MTVAWLNKTTRLNTEVAGDLKCKQASCVLSSTLICTTPFLQTLDQCKQPWWCLMALPLVEIQAWIFFLAEAETEEVLNKQSPSPPLSLCIELWFDPRLLWLKGCRSGEGYPGWFPLIPSGPTGQAVFEQQHRRIQEVEEIPSLPLMLGPLLPPRCLYNMGSLWKLVLPVYSLVIDSSYHSSLYNPKDVV